MDVTAEHRNCWRTSHRKVLLLVEDDDQRAAAIKACLPPDIHCVWTKSAGAALGVLKRDKFSGAMLDFDLYRSTHGETHSSRVNRSRQESARLKAGPARSSFIGKTPAAPEEPLSCCSKPDSRLNSAPGRQKRHSR
jgi:hypothetical protein